MRKLILVAGDEAWELHGLADFVVNCYVLNWYNHHAIVLSGNYLRRMSFAQK